MSEIQHIVDFRYNIYKGGIAAMKSLYKFITAGCLVVIIGGAVFWNKNYEGEKTHELVNIRATNSESNQATQNTSKASDLSGSVENQDASVDLSAGQEEVQGDEKYQAAAKKLKETGDKYLDMIMNEIGEDNFTNQAIAAINYKAFLSFEMDESLRKEYEDKLKRTSVQDDNCSIYSAVSKDGVHFIAVAYPRRDSDSYESAINTITGNENEYEFFKSFIEPPGIADPIYYAVDLYVEDLLGDKQNFEVELWEPSVGATAYPVEHPELDGNVEKILKKYNRAVPSSTIRNKEWNLFLFQSYAADPVFMLRYDKEVIELKG